MAKVEYIIYTNTKEPIEAKIFLNEDYVTLGELRRKQKESILFKKPLFICGKCEQPLALKGRPKNNKKFYLAHLKDSKDCEWKTGDDRTKFEIHQEMFFKVRESEKHKELKAFIVDKLTKDKQFSQVKSEKRFKSDFQEKYKVPDVSTIKTKNNGFIDIKTNIVFEIQLTSTYLDVIIDREKFYYENKANILWIFANFSKDLSRTKMVEDDILFSNKKNVFILDEEAKKISIKNKSLYLKNLYLEVFLNKGDIDYKWSKGKIVNINEINFDTITGKSFCYNFEHERAKELYKKKLKNKKFKENFDLIQECLIESIDLKKSFMGLLESKNIIDDGELFNSLRDSEDIIRYIFEIIYLRKENKVFDHRFPNLKDNKNSRIIQMLNNAFNPALKNSIYSNFLLKAIDYYGQSSYLIEIDKKGSFTKKVLEHKKYISEELSPNNLKALQYLFPELFFLKGVPK
jgi:hypothetical protein